MANLTRCDMGMLQYRQHEAVSASGLKVFIRKSPFHYREYLAGRLEQDSAAMQFGSAFHSYMEGPEVFRNSYVAAPELDRRTKAGKEAFSEFSAQHAGKTVISRFDLSRITDMSESLLRVPAIRDRCESFLAERESSWFWTDSESSLPCKARTDLFLPGEVLDYKTTTDASPESFSYSIRKFLYHLSAHHYLTGIGAERFGWIAVENQYPYSAALYWLKPDREYRRIAEVYRESMDRLAECIESDHWPFVESGEMELSI